jgi:hypothetical protein
MTATMTEAPSLGDLVGNIDQSLDNAGAGRTERQRMTPVWPAVREGVAKGMRDQLEKADLLELLAEGWAKTEALMNRAAEHMANSDVTLASHDQELTFDPGFVITVGGVGAQRLPLSLVLDASIGGAILTLEDGAITEVEIGKVSFSGHLDWAGVLTPINVDAPEFTLLGKHKLKHPTPIRRP